MAGNFIEPEEWPAIRDSLPPAQFIWEGIIPAQGKTLLHSAPHVGKSSFTWGLFNACKTGEPYLGIRTEKKRCLLLSNDMNKYEYKARWELNFNPLFTNYLMPKMDITSPKFPTSKWFDEVYQYINVNNVDVVGIDALGGIHTGQQARDDHVAGMVDAVLDGWLGNRAVILIGHDKKTQYAAGGVPIEPTNEDFLGSQMWRANATSQIHMYKTGPHRSSLKHEKSQVSIQYPETLSLYINLHGMAELWNDQRAVEVVKKFNDTIRTGNLQDQTPTVQVRAVAAAHSVTERTAWRWYSLAHP